MTCPTGSATGPHLKEFFRESIEAAEDAIETFGEDGALILPDASRRSIQMIVMRQDPHSSEEQGQLQPRFVVRILADSTLGATATELDAGTWKAVFPDEVDGTALVHDIDRKHGHFHGSVHLEIYGAGRPDV